MGGGFAGDTFQDMLDGALADAMAGAGGLGMTQTFETALGGEPAVPSGQRPRASAEIAAAYAVPTTGTATAATGAAAGGRSTVPAPVIAGPGAAATGLGPDRLVQPAVGRLSSGFGTRIHPVTHLESAHLGLDIAAPTGTEVVAAANGRVTHAGPAGTYGNLVTIRHADGTETRYAHLSVVRVQRGDQVAAGARIGDVGNTGNSTGPHLHFEVRKDGHAVDPRPLLPGAPRNK